MVSLRPSTRTVTVAGSAATAEVASTENSRRTSRVATDTRVDRCIEPTPFHEGLWALAGGRSPGSRAYPSAPSRSAGGGSVAALTSRSAQRGASPVTVAGPRRILTGFPSTTDRMNVRDPTPSQRRRCPAPTPRSRERGALAARRAAVRSAISRRAWSRSSERPTVSAAFDGAVLQVPVREAAFLEGPAHDLLVPLVRGADVLEFAPVGEHGVEVGDHVVGHVPAEHVQRGGLAVVEGHVPVLDPHRAPPWTTESYSQMSPAANTPGTELSRREEQRTPPRSPISRPAAARAARRG